MGLLGKLLGRPSKEDKAEQEKLDRAEQIGRNAATSMVRDLDSFMAIRFGHIKEAYLDILRANMTEDLARVDHSPLLLARADYSVFLDNVRDTVPRMKEEIMSHMAEWQSTFAQMGLDAEVERVADGPGDKSDAIAFQLNMTTSGLIVVTDRAEELKAADDAWRVNYPEQARLEQLGD